MTEHPAVSLTLQKELQLRAALHGVTLDDTDRRMLAWSASLMDKPTIDWLTSLLNRTRVAASSSRKQWRARPATGDTFLSVAEVAEQLNFSERTVWRWIDAGKLPAFRVGGRAIRIRRSDLAAISRRVPRTREGRVPRRKPAGLNGDP